MKIFLNAGSLAMLESNEPFILPEKIELEFVSRVYKLGTLHISAKNGDTKEAFTLRQAPYNIALKDTVKAGKIELEIAYLVSGDVVKTWRVPDIIIKDVNHTFEAIPEIEELKTEIAKLKQGFADILKLI